MNVNDDDGLYVCISHECLVPCEHEGQHLISNWIVDVNKILENMEK